MGFEGFDAGGSFGACAHRFDFGAEDFLSCMVGMSGKWGSGQLREAGGKLTFRRSTVATRLFARSRSATIMSTSASFVTTSLSNPSPHKNQHKIQTPVHKNVRPRAGRTGG